MKTVNETVQEFYSSQSLDDETVQKIIMQGKMRYRRKLFSRVAAMLLLCVGTIFSVSTFRAETVLRSTVAEIRRNHMKGEAPEMLSNDYDEISKHLNKLAFAVNPTQQLNDYELFGGLYCSVQGHKAAQLKFVTPANDTATLFVTEWEGVLKRLKRSSRIGNGVKVTVWKEGDLFYGLAENE